MNNIENNKTKKVLLGMSGGVDSSVSALLLKQKEYEVIGITMELYEDNNNNSIDAKKVCDSLGIKHSTYDLREEFKCKVINNFIEEYSNQKTPNPCIQCNKYMKFGYMYEKAKQLGCDYIATGHYAKVEYSEKYGRYVIKKANNAQKDQSYVLYDIPKEILDKIIFPLGEFKTKEEIRNIARENNLKVANKPDSEDICFIPEGNYRKFLEENSNLKPIRGNIVNKNGEILGEHSGLYNYTIGQRKGLGVSYKEPLFVIGFNKEKNEVVVGTKEEKNAKEMYVNNVNLLLVDEIKGKMEVKVKTRYSAKEEPAIIEMLENEVVKVTFNNASQVTPGQSAVFYIEDCVLGGGKIMQKS